MTPENRRNPFEQCESCICKGQAFACNVRALRAAFRDLVSSIFEPIFGEDAYEDMEDCEWYERDGDA